jgi:hypothetical protein
LFQKKIRAQKLSKDKKDTLMFMCGVPVVTHRSAAEEF